MKKILKMVTSKWLFGYMIIAFTGIALVHFINEKSSKDFYTALQNYTEQRRLETEQSANNISNSFGYIYQGIRTISLLPSVKTIDRYGKNLDKNAHESIVQIYNNMASNVAVSEVYIVPVDFDPEKKDLITGKQQEPILMFDNKISDKETTSEKYFEEEIHEYRLIHEQVIYFKQHYPDTENINHQNPPMISGREVITCDNTEYNKTKNDDDRLGIVFSLPFYGEDGKLKGVISAIIRSNSIKKLMPDTNYALINNNHDYIVTAKDNVQAADSKAWILQLKPDPSLFFSTIVNVPTPDPQSKWMLWAGFPNQLFSDSPDVKAIQDFKYLGYIGSALLVLFSAIIWAILQYNFNFIKKTNSELEKRVHSHTSELEQTVALMDIMKTIAITANEVSSINEGFQTAIDVICNYTDWSVGHAYIYSEEKKKLVNLNVWHTKYPQRCANFKKISESIEFASNEGFLGKVFADSAPIWILDIENSSIYARKESAISANLKSVFGFPVFIGRKAVAVLEFYSGDSLVPSEELLSVMSNVGKQLGQVIERANAMERSKLLETIISSADDGIIITKANLEEPGPEIIYANDAFTKISGYTAEEAIGRSPRFLQSDFTKRETLDALRSTLLAGKPFKDELLNQHKNGQHYWLEISIVPVKNSQGIVTHFAAIERDISTKKQEEINQKNISVELKKAQLKAESTSRELEISLKKAEEASIAKSDFLANMSHELRTPMNGVLGMASLLADTQLNDEQREFVSTINGSAENLLMLLNDILDFSKIEAGALVLENIAFGFTDNLRKTINLLRPQAEKKHIDLILECKSDVPAYIWGDSGRIRQIIMNLVGNAIKFTEHGHVRLSASVQKNINEDDKLYISVEDTGVGIPAGKLSEIFDKFTQADASVTRRYGGTGLGLAISKQLVNLMGGEINVESVEGKGSTFWFTIPCKIADIKDAPVKNDERDISNQSLGNLIPIGKAKILLVEDYHVNQVFAIKLLRKFGFIHIDLAENGVQAIEKYRKENYDMIFMDCQMPELDGYQATQKLRMLEEGLNLHTPIIAMTANAMMGDREKCLKAGMDDYLSKPLRAEHLRKILEMWFLLESEKATISAPQPSVSLPEETKEAPVDLEQLRMFTDGDPEEEKALAALFLEQSQAMIKILQESTGDDKKEAWKSAAHRFKGSSGNLGANKLQLLCKQAEAGFENNESQKLEMLTAIKEETKRIEVFFG